MTTWRSGIGKRRPKAIARWATCAGLARVATAIRACMETFHGRPNDGIATIQVVLDEIDAAGDARESIALRAALARSYLFADDYPGALRLIDEVLMAAERVDDIALITDAVLTKGTTLLYAARFREGLVLLTGGLQLAETHGYVQSELRARLNISFLQQPDDPRSSAQMARTGLELARRLGFGDWTMLLAGNLIGAQLDTGDWDAGVAIAEELVPHAVGVDATELVGGWLVIRALRGGDATIAADMDRLRDAMRAVTASQEQTLLTQVELWLALADGHIAEVASTDLDPGEPLNRAARLPGRGTCGHLESRRIPDPCASAERSSRPGIHGRWSPCRPRRLRSGGRCARRGDSGGIGAVPRSPRTSST